MGERPGNIRAIGGSTVHSGDPTIKCGYRDRIAYENRESTVLPVNCKFEIEQMQQNHGPKSEPPVEAVDDAVAEREAEGAVMAFRAKLAPADHIAAAISELTIIMIHSLNPNGTPFEVATRLERLGLGLIRLGYHIEEHAA